MPSSLSPARVSKAMGPRPRPASRSPTSPWTSSATRPCANFSGRSGRSNIGRHDTRHEAAGVETNGSSKLYEFGDTLNLDITATLSSVFAREGLATAIEGEEHAPLNIYHSDIHVHQADYQSSCATVVLLDCSHSMILYGEDRFTPAKRVAMALAHLIRTQFPGDTLNLVLFHDTAEEIPVSQLSRVKVGPHYTNTREGLRLAQRILARQNKDMKQIVHDHRRASPARSPCPTGASTRTPSASTRLVIAETLEEVARCKRSNIMINTFMLASDFALMQFVQKVSAMCRGKAYFTTPQDAGQLSPHGLHVAPHEDRALGSSENHDR